MASVIVAAVIAAAFIAAVVVIKKKKLMGKCGGSCEGCMMNCKSRK